MTKRALILLLSLVCMSVVMQAQVYNEMDAMTLEKKQTFENIRDQLRSFTKKRQEETWNIETEILPKAQILAAC